MAWTASVMYMDLGHSTCIRCVRRRKLVDAEFTKVIFNAVNAGD
jgi:hypothetical protein